MPSHSQEILEAHSLNGAPIDLNDKFRAAIRIMEGARDNLLITGRAGTGKSTLLEYFRSITKKNVAVVAPTGVAAINVKGQTIHSFFRFRPDITIDAVEELPRYLKDRYATLDTLVIDEISMVRADLLDCIEKFLRLNGPDRTLPFGGVQVIFVGDLYQLPPIVTKDEEGMFNGPYRSQYFFDSGAFRQLSVRSVELDRHYRQTEEKFIWLLNAIRNGTATDMQLELLNTRLDPDFRPDPSKLFITLTTTNRLADEMNSEELGRLASKPHYYKATIDGDFDRATFPADEVLEIKEGAQVMLLNNDREKRWVNGSVGRVVSIGQKDGADVIGVELLDESLVQVARHTWDVFRFTYDKSSHKLVPKVAGSFAQYPVTPAWAVTIHKSQGKTFDNVIIDIGTGTFANGQLYVALSRCTTLKGIVLRKRISKMHMLTDRRVTEFLERSQH